MISQPLVPYPQFTKRKSPDKILWMMPGLPSSWVCSLTGLQTARLLRTGAPESGYAGISRSFFLQYGHLLIAIAIGAFLADRKTRRPSGIPRITPDFCRKYADNSKSSVRAGSDSVVVSVAVGACILSALFGRRGWMRIGSLDYQLGMGRITPQSNSGFPRRTLKMNVFRPVITAVALMIPLGLAQATTNISPPPPPPV